MLGSLYSGISGLNVNAKAMSVIGNNIANVSTHSYKTNNATFANLMSQSLGGSGGEGTGRGVKFWDTSTVWSQGSLENTGNATDMAISGRGFFKVCDDNGTSFYTRVGQFEFDKDRKLVNPDDLIVQGYQIDGNGVLGTLGDIIISEPNSPPKPTDTIALNMNLNADASDGETYLTSISTYDSLGSTVPLAINFTYDATNSKWDWAASSSAGTCSSTGSLKFDANGNLDPASCSPSSSNPTINLTGLTSGASDISVTLTYLNNINQSDGSITGYSSNSETSLISQNGYSSGSLQNIQIDENGVVAGAYSNGQLTPLFQIALTDFANYSGLNNLGENLYTEALSSGQALPGTAGSGRLGAINTGALESSNVDLAEQFVKMITTERAFQANSRVITTSDEILNELINLKR